MGLYPKDETLKGTIGKAVLHVGLCTNSKHLSVER